MAGTRSPWHALRPILLAGAAAVTWLTLSATASSADVLSDASSLLGETTGSVSSVAKKLTEPAGTVVRHAPDPVQQTIPVAPKPVSVSPKPAPGSSDRGLLSPVAGGVSGLADNVASSLPIVKQVVPAGTVATVTAPVATAVDATTVAVTEVAAAPVAGLPVLEPVVSPVAEVVAGVAPVLDPVVAPVTEIVTDVSTRHSGTCAGRGPDSGPGRSSGSGGYGAFKRCSTADRRPGEQRLRSSRSSGIEHRRHRRAGFNPRHRGGSCWWFAFRNACGVGSSGG